MKILKYWKSIVIALIILYGSLTSSSNLNKFSFLHIKNIDKLIHFTLYFLLSISFQSSLIMNTLIERKQQIILTFTFVISYGIVMEMLQYYITIDRSADLFDALANIVGCISGILVLPVVKKFNLIKYL